MQEEMLRHNRYQIDYFEGTLKKRMLPRRSPYLERHVDKMIEWGRLTPGEEILEVGCGMGRYTLLFLEKGFNVSGLDISEGLLNRLRKFNAGRYPLTLYCEDIGLGAERIQRRFDAVIGLFTLHHMHDLDRAFQGMRSLLKPGGRIVFLEPNPQNPLYYVQILFTPKMKWSMERGMLRLKGKAVLNMLGKAGFIHTAYHRFGFFPPFITNAKIGLSLEKRLEKVSMAKPFLPFQMFKAERDGT
jgi:SAM-dependent methyltransferase